VCYVSNARPDAGFTGVLQLRTLDLLTGAQAAWAALPVAVPPGPGAVGWAAPNASLALPNATTTLLVARLVGAAGEAVEEHIVWLAPPRALAAPPATVAAVVAAAPNGDGSVNVTVTADAVALLVTLTAAAPGRFTDNAFLLPPGARVVQWLPFAPGDATGTLRCCRRTAACGEHIEPGPGGELVVNRSEGGPGEGGWGGWGL
jgi:hypothetical protein